MTVTELVFAVVRLVSRLEGELAAVGTQAERRELFDALTRARPSTPTARALVASVLEELRPAYEAGELFAGWMNAYALMTVDDA